jgi:hypothetical protein
MSTQVNAFNPQFTSAIPATYPCASRLNVLYVSISPMSTKSRPVIRETVADLCEAGFFDQSPSHRVLRQTHAAAAVAWALRLCQPCEVAVDRAFDFFRPSRFLTTARLASMTASFGAKLRPIGTSPSECRRRHVVPPSSFTPSHESAKRTTIPTKLGD